MWGREWCECGVEGGDGFVCARQCVRACTCACSVHMPAQFIPCTGKVVTQTPAPSLLPADQEERGRPKAASPQRAVFAAQSEITASLRSSRGFGPQAAATPAEAAEKATAETLVAFMPSLAQVLAMLCCPISPRWSGKGVSL